MNPVRILSAVLGATMIAILQTPAAQASEYFFKASGTGSTCTAAAPCTLQSAITKAVNMGDQLSCADNGDSSTTVGITVSITIDCAGTTGSLKGLAIDGGATVTLKNFAVFGDSAGVTIVRGTAILENLHFTANGNGIFAIPSGISKLVVRNSIFDNNGSGVIIRPFDNFSDISATFDHVSIIGNRGGGIRGDTANSRVTVDIFDSNISYNSGNGINAVGGAGGPNIMSVKNSVIASNGAAGVQANGSTAAVMMDTTLLDSNAGGALSAVGDGKLLTYGNNRIVGSPGSGFTGSLGQQ